MTERVKVGSAYICVDGDPSCAADWPGVMNPRITAHRALILRECYFAQSNYSSIFAQQRLSSIRRSIRVKMSPASDNRAWQTHEEVCASLQAERIRGKRRRDEGNDMTGSTRGNIIKQKLDKIPFSVFCFVFNNQDRAPRATLIQHILPTDVRHCGIWQTFPLSKSENVCQNDRSKNISRINDVTLRCWISRSWHLLGFADAPPGWLARSQPGSPVSQRSDWLWKIEPDGNWLHITCLLQLKKVSSRWGIKKVWELKRRGHLYLSQRQPSSRSAHCQQAPRGEEGEEEGEERGAG